MSIYDPEPGPLERVPDNALAPFPGGRSFEGIVADYLGDGGARDQQLARAGSDAAGDGEPTVDDAFAQTVGVAVDVVNQQSGVAGDTTGGVLSDRTEGAEAYRQAALPHLPQPEAPIQGDYVDPPRPAGLDPGDDHPVDDSGRRV